MRMPTLLVLLAALTPAVPSAAAAPARCPGVTRNGPWQRIAAPAFPPAPHAAGAWTPIETYAAAPGGRLFVTNGNAVRRSTDGGCTWTTVFTVAAGHQYREAAGGYVSAHAVQVRAIVPAAGNRAYLVTSVTSAGGLARVYASTDGGATFAPAGPPIPAMPAFGAESIAVAPSDPRRLYLAVRPAVAFTGAPILRSDDGGATWAPVGGSTMTTSVLYGAVNGVAVDARDPDVVYAFGAQTPLLRSTDGGTSFAVVPTSGAAPSYGRSLALTRPAAGPSDVVFSDGDAVHGVARGRHRVLGSRLRARTVAAGASFGSVLVDAHDGTRSSVYRWSPRGRAFVLVPGPRDSRDARTDGAARPAYYVVTDAALYRYAGPAA